LFASDFGGGKPPLSCLGLSGNSGVKVPSK
jgi:hypothetical protein